MEINSIKVICMRLFAGLLAFVVLGFFALEIEAKNICPSTSFDVFFNDLLKEEDSRRHYINNSVFLTFMDVSTEPEPSKKQKIISPKIADSYIQKIKENNLHTIIHGHHVKAHKPDTDYQFWLYFKKADDCWSLYKIVDDSL